MKKAIAAATVLLIVSCSGCPQMHPIDAPDINLPEPSELQVEQWRRNEAWRSDPCRVADYELKLHLDICEWAHEPFNPAKYTYTERNEKNPLWGPYVTRGSVDSSGRLWRYRVKVRKSGDVWYAVQVSHYLVVELEHPALEGGGPPRPN